MIQLLVTCKYTHKTTRNKFQDSLWGTKIIPHSQTCYHYFKTKEPLSRNFKQQVLLNIHHNNCEISGYNKTKGNPQETIYWSICTFEWFSDLSVSICLCQQTIAVHQFHNTFEWFSDLSVHIDLFFT